MEHHGHGTLAAQRWRDGFGRLRCIMEVNVLFALLSVELNIFTWVGFNPALELYIWPAPQRCWSTARFSSVFKHAFLDSKTIIIFNRSMQS